MASKPPKTELVESYLMAYLTGDKTLDNDEREVLLFALYLESLKHGGIAAKVVTKLDAANRTRQRGEQPGEGRK